MRKKLIEVALPLEAINEASAREKSIRHGHPSTLHLWWARRPLAACRAVIFASLVDDPDDPEALPEFVAACRRLRRGKNAAANDTPRQRLFDFIEELVQWKNTTNETILEQARELIRIATGGNPPPLLDPFAGGGSIPLEAQRLGLEAHASDLNPVAVMINKALIEIPPKFANRPPVNPRDRAKIASSGGWQGAAGLAADVRYYGEWMRERAYERIGHLYPKCNGETVIAWLWARTVKCPNPACGAQMPLVRSFDLSKKKGRKAWIEPQVDPQTRQISYFVHKGEGIGPEGTVNRKGATCLACGTPVAFEYIRAEGKAKRMGAQLMAIVTEGKNGRNYHAPTSEHEQIARVDIPEDAPDTDLPEQALGFRVQLYGMTKHRDLFTPRQLVALTTFSDLVSEAREQIGQDARHAGMSEDDTPLCEGGDGAQAYAEAISIYLSFVLDKQADLGNNLCRWEPVAQCPRQLFARQAIAMVWDYAEGNPLGNSSGSWQVLINNVSRDMQSGTFNFNKIHQGFVYQSDAANSLHGESLLISTDPPYYDNIGYAALSDFFYVWMRSNLKNVFSSIFGTVLVPKAIELIADPHRFNGDSNAANEHFEKGLMKAFSIMRQIISFEYPLTIYYAFKQTELVVDEGVSSSGWETMLLGLIDAGFEIVGTWPIRTEASNRMRSFDSNALASSIVLVCRPRPENAPLCARREFLNALRQELPQALREMQSGNIAPVDLAQASIGPGMAVYSRYSKVLEPDGERLSVRTALQLINQELDAYLVEQEGELDGDSRFALAWFEQFGFKEGAFGQADVLARAKNTSVEGLTRAGLLKSAAGKVQLLPWKSLPEDWQPAAEARLTIWQAAHQLIKRFHIQGEQGAGELLAQLPPDIAAEARQLAYRLYTICERKGWADHARDYNALVISWNASQEHAQKLKNEPQQEELKLQELIYKQE